MDFMTAQGLSLMEFTRLQVRLWETLVEFSLESRSSIIELNFGCLDETVPLAVDNPSLVFVYPVFKLQRAGGDSH
jgi:hypothetical protein